MTAILPSLYKSKALPEPSFDLLEEQVWLKRLLLLEDRSGASPLNPERLHGFWKEVPNSQRHKNQVMLQYARLLNSAGVGSEAEELLRKALRQRYDADLALLYGSVQGADAARQLQTAEAWLTQNPEDPKLLLGLGRLSLQNRLWGKARDYFEHSLKLDRNIEACAELARLLAHQGDLRTSNQLLRDSLQLLALDLPPLPQPGPA